MAVKCSEKPWGVLPCWPASIICLSSCPFTNSIISASVCLDWEESENQSCRGEHIGRSLSVLPFTPAITKDGADYQPLLWMIALHFFRAFFRSTGHLKSTPKYCLLIQFSRSTPSASLQALLTMLERSLCPLESLVVYNRTPLRLVEAGKKLIKAFEVLTKPMGGPENQNRRLCLQERDLSLF